MPNSAILDIPQVAPNQNNKETTINDATSIMERSTNDAVAVDMSAGNVTLNLTDFTRHFVFVCSGHAVPRNLTIPAGRLRVFAVKNDGTGTITVKYPTGGTSTVDAAVRTILFADGTAVNFLASAIQPGTAFYDIGFTFEDMPPEEDDQTYVVTRGMKILADFDGSQAYANDAPTATAIFTFAKNGVDFGTFTISAGSHTGVFDCPETTFVAGDRLTCTAPITQDDTLADVGITIVTLR